MSKRLLLLLCLLVVAGSLTAGFLIRASSPRRQAEKLLGQVGPDHLREAAAKLYKDLFATRGPDYATVKETSWPAQFSAFQPIHVAAYRDGFALALVNDHETESGIYVIPAYTDFQPRVTARWRYKRLTEGVYWYSFDQ